jgi:Flp pilus assembly protein TadB
MRGVAAPSLRRRVVASGIVGFVVLVATGVDRWMLVLLGAAVVVGVRRRARAPSPAELPLTLDLLAASLRGGALLPAAVEAAASAASTPLRAHLLSVARSLRAGSEAVEAWSAVDDDRDLVSAARICCRTSVSGAATATELERLARRLRMRRRSELDAAAARASVWVVLPLCLCFLPAFVLVGVVPLAIGLLESVR